MGYWTLFFSLLLSSMAGARTTPQKLHGLTLDSVDGLNEIVDSLRSLSRFPTTRIVFDEYEPAKDYRRAVEKIHPVSFILGEILDSYFIKEYSVSAYSKRVTEYLDVLSDKVDIWEIGNEINGEWLGDTSDVIRKVTDAYDLVTARGFPTALTLYYNEGCWEKPQNEMFRWAEKNIPKRMKEGLTYVLVSYYEDDCEDLQPNWAPVFERLGKMFPKSRIGFSEVGTEKPNRKLEYLRRYYSIQISHPRYVGGYFWWYGRQDLVPKSQPLWSVFNELISAN